MDYVVGSIAALISGNVTPNRPRIVKKAFTPTKHQPSPNVTPKCEVVDDRTLFLSPSLQKKKAIVKKSPKRIFQSPPVDTTSENKSLVPNTDKVKKHLKDGLEEDINTNSFYVSKSTYENKESKKSSKKDINNSDVLTIKNVSNEISKPSKKKKKQNKEDTENSSDGLEYNLNTSACQVSEKKRGKSNYSTVTEDNAERSPKKTKKKHSENNHSVEGNNYGKKKKHLLETDLDHCVKIDLPNYDNDKIPEKKKHKKKEKNLNDSTVTEVDIEKLGLEYNLNTSACQVSEKKRGNSNYSTVTEDNAERSPKKTKKKHSENNHSVEGNNYGKKKNHLLETDLDHCVKIDLPNYDNDKIPEKKKHKKKEKNLNDSTVTEFVIEKLSKKVKRNHSEDLSVNSVEAAAEISEEISDIKNKKKKNKNYLTESENVKGKSKKKIKQNLSSEESLISVETSIKKKKIKVNPNAITHKDTDSEHDSDDAIESENEEINNKVLESNGKDESSDEEEEEYSHIKSKRKAQEEPQENSVTSEDEAKRTIFVGNVPFSPKCKKEIKKIFRKHGQIETIRIRTVPVKDPRTTPKLAVIKQELHPERSTINVYVKFMDESSVDKALAENNTVLNDCHLRVTRSNTSGAYDPKLCIFVGNLPFAMEDDTLRSKFKKCGEIASVRIIRDKRTNAGKGFGYVNFASKDGVELALSLTDEDLTIKNRILRVKRCTVISQRRNQSTSQVNLRKTYFDKGQRKTNFDKGQDSRNTGAFRRVTNKRKFENNNTDNGPPNKKTKNIQQPKNQGKKERKEFVGMTAEKKKKSKFNKGQKKKKVLSEILSKRRQ